MHPNGPQSASSSGPFRMYAASAMPSSAISQHHSAKMKSIGMLRNISASLAASGAPTHPDATMMGGHLMAAAPMMMVAGRRSGSEGALSSGSDDDEDDDGGSSGDDDEDDDGQTDATNRAGCGRKSQRRRGRRGNRHNGDNDDEDGEDSDVDIVGDPPKMYT